MPAAHNHAMVDIHCHMLPAIDDGSTSLEESLQMARMAVNDGIATVIVTPHQLGNFAHNSGEVIRKATRQFQTELDRAAIPLRVLPGADVRIEATMTRKIMAGEVLSLADRKKHVLLELPHELYFPVEPVLCGLAKHGMVGILSHPERNQGILRQRDVIAPLVAAGCLMQITAGSLTGSMGKVCQEFCHWMLRQGTVHFVSTDAHGVKSRRPLLRKAYDIVASLTDAQTAHALCVTNPAAVAAGGDVPAGRRPTKKSKAGGWFGLKRAG